MRNAPDILAGLVISQYVDFLESGSMTCPMSPDIFVKVVDGGKEFSKGRCSLYCKTQFVSINEFVPSKLCLSS